MTTTTMHFGPEWMRKAPSRANPSPPLATPTTTGASTYSALVAPAPNAPPERPDPSNPFRYSKDDMIRIYKEGGGKGGLGLEVERWEGIVREVGSDPIALKEMSEADKKIFAGPLNSEMRRRPSTDYLSLSTAGLGDRSKLSHANNGANSPMRERLGGFMGRRRDSTDQPPLTLPRKLSQSSLQPPPLSPRDALPSPRTRLGSGFDGVLSDSWSSRRRTSEGLVKGVGRPGEAGDPQDGPKTAGIKEEEEENRDTQHNAPQSNGLSSGSLSDMPPVSPAVANGLVQVGSDSLSSSMSHMPLGARTHSTDGTGPITSATIDNDPSGAPPGIADPASVEWSYLDPQGQVQGPFPALTMQKWYDDGYFASTLLMKRPQIDTEWTPVGELLQRAGNSRLFLSLLPTPPPPGLHRRDSLLEGPVQDGSFGSPFQPVPTRSLRTSTLDSYLHNGTMVPDSPSSQFSAGRFSNESPDPNAFGARLGTHPYNGSPVGPRLGFPGLSGSGPEAQRRATFENAVDPLLSRQNYTSFTQGRGATDALGFGDGINVPNAYVTSNASQASLTDKSDDFTNSRTLPNGQSSFTNNDFGPSSFLNNREGPRLIKRELFERSDSQSAVTSQFANSSIPFSTSGQLFGQMQPLSYTSPDTRPMQSMQSTPERQPATAVGAQQSFVPPPVNWPPQDAIPPRRPGPFDPDYPTSRNTVAQKVVAPVQPSVPHIRTGPSVVVNSQSPWYASQPVAGDAWGPDPSSLTAANLGQHNKQQELQDKEKTQPSKPLNSPVARPEESVARPKTAPQPEPEPEPSTTVTEAPASTRPRRKPTAFASVAAQSTAKSAAVDETTSPKPPSPVAVVAESKSPWSKDEDKKTTGASLTLREIQELEMKKLEARKIAERERERTARAAAASASSSSDDVQTLSWGLPTSQAGARAAKELPVLSAAAVTPTTPVVPSAPVWTTASKAPGVKKTMKEIQEEEEKRKKQAKDKESVTAAARRAYADTTNRALAPVAAATVQTGGAWTTVGASGKAGTTTPTPARPAISTSSLAKAPAQSIASASLSAASVVIRSPAVSTPSRSPVVTAAMKLAPSTPRNEETPAPPSHELLKWLADSLKGLNTSVNLEEITSMLLSFPLDPDPSTMEIISELIYANSTTLDGRRFATEFVGKRKADVRGSSVAGSSGKPLSIADVVRTQPKPAQNEWGGFKVVNKKKKSARS